MLPALENSPTPASESPRSKYRCVCGILHGNEGAGPVDREGCVLGDGHEGPHEFVEPNGRRWLWETDLECDCEHCMLCEGDYCTVYWKKPTA